MKLPAKILILDLLVVGHMVKNLDPDGWYSKGSLPIAKDLDLPRAAIIASIEKLMIEGYLLHRTRSNFDDRIGALKQSPLLMSLRVGACFAMYQDILSMAHPKRTEHTLIQQETPKP